ncbi:hypothetical protein QFC22_001249 [Naganishia vaughanmartiniae]|uniref:Uncharacterized protein n=1 Tax=Naganishia vaughanmartiniae TaxID=1424756 RepID=A0ACC2XI37_9TREE|nr:hypothetical protein QFC22_001249 [Naganishia vaughanmartiniae]
MVIPYGPSSSSSPSIPIPFFLSRTAKRLLVSCRILSDQTPKTNSSAERKESLEEDRTGADGTTFPASTPPINQHQPTSDDRAYFTLGLATAPVIGVLLLLASTSIGGQVLRNGIVGIQGVKPYDIMTLFISLVSSSCVYAWWRKLWANGDPLAQAYISISLDCTGSLRFLAFWVALKGGTSGRKLYLYFYLFFFVFGVIVGNDPIILSGTSFLAYFSRIAGISPPRAWTFAQFAASNVASAVLVSSNPTNLVLTGAYDISFLVYSAWLVLPVLATSLVLLPLLMFGVFNDQELVPRRLETPDVDPKTALIDRNGAIFGSTLLAITLVSLVTLSAVNLLHGVEGVWTVTAPAAILMLARDIWHDLHHGGFQEKQADDVKAQGLGDLDGRQRRIEAAEIASAGVGSSPRQGEIIEMTDTRMESRQRPASLTQRFSSIKQPSLPLPASTSSAPPSKSAPPANASNPAQEGSTTQPPTGSVSPKTSLASTFRALKLRLPTVSYVVSHLPLPLLPFAFSMFILVEALQHVGWIRVWGGWWKAWVAVAGLPGAVWLMAMLSVLGCNAFGTNIGATILLSRVLQQWSTNNTVSERVLYGSLYTLALGSNYGAFSFTFSASLAGLLWKQILAQKGILVGRVEFAKYNTIPVVVCMIIGSLVIAGEVCIMYKS